jgi:GTP-binding protein Era
MPEKPCHAGYVGLVGRPNVGKSTLLNRLLAQKLAITSHKPQTTRHRIVGIKTRTDGQIVYVDTPGIHQRSAKAMSHYLNRTAHTVLSDVDLVVFVVQALAWTDEDQGALNALCAAGSTIVVAVNKIDTVKPKDQLLPFMAEVNRHGDFAAIIPVSAQLGENCDMLEQQVWELLPAGELIYPEDQLSDRGERFFAAELLREQIMRRYHKELPYATSVEIEHFEMRKQMLHIGAVVWVERDSQRGILIGQRGDALKATAKAARQQMEAFFERKVNLKVWVKVKRAWSRDAKSLTQLGYTD